MIIMDISLDNFFSFRNFHMNLSYPKKIVNSFIENEYLTERPNFRYKKAIHLSMNRFFYALLSRLFSLSCLCLISTQ